MLRLHVIITASPRHCLATSAYGACGPKYPLFRDFNKEINQKIILKFK